MNVQRVDEANAHASGKITSETINNYIDSLANKYAKTIKVDGFRRGKVPVSLVKSRYKENLREESRQKSIDEFYANAIKELGLNETDVIGQPLISKFEENKEGIDIELKIGITPKFDIDNIYSCIPTFTLETILDTQIDERLIQLAKARAPIVESNSTILEKEHIANIDFEGFMEGKAFEGGKAHGFELTIGSNQFIPGFEEALIGMKIGEEKTINVTFPQEYQVANFAGKVAQFTVKLNAIKQRGEVKLDDKFAKAVLGNEEKNTLEILREQVKNDLQREAKLKLYNEKLKEEVLNNIAKAFNFDLPQNILEQEMNVLFNNEISMLKQEEIQELQNNKDKSKDLYEAQREKATTSVKVTFIVDKLAKQEKIHVDDNEVFQALYYDSMMNGQNPQDVIEQYRKNNLLPAVKMAMIEDRVITHLLDKHNGLKK